ncbi:MAG: hypothetical protein FWB96_02205 [Defluviitaleaceae bacterium]|nr:hypothetical protein [Defluviitaleaceae bacterium]MCL2262350.1 hypothetical protein [Defluviitaleaceae bacterium]
MTLSAKYNMIYPPLVARIIAEESEKKDPTKAAKTRMHQLYGAYLQGNAHKKAAGLLEEPAEKILQLHASTKERLPHLQDFFAFVLKHAGESVTQILDLGCGFNPFSIPLMPRELTRNLAAYHAYDIDLRTRDLLNIFFGKIGLPPAAACADLAVETPSEAVDVAFMLKLVPVLEAQCKNRGFSLANALNTRFLVVSFPTKSLGGRDKGMEKNYAALFANACESGLLHNFTQTATAHIGNELVYILARCP